MVVWKVGVFSASSEMNGRRWAYLKELSDITGLVRD